MRTHLIVCLCGVMVASSARGDDASGLNQRLLDADMGSALDSADQKPWHLKMTVQVFDDKGKPSDHGTIEEWWGGPGMDRREYKTSAYTATEIRKDGTLYRTEKAGTPPYYLNLLRSQLVHPIPKEADTSTAKPEMRKTPFGKVSLDCIMLTEPIKGALEIPLGLFPTYCFDPGKASLRASFDFGGQLILRNGLGTFAGKSVATSISVSSDRVQAAAGQVVILKGEDVPDSQFALEEGETEQKVTAVRVSSGTMAGSLLTKPDPIYPASAKANHTSGTVILHAVIGTDGHVHSLKIVSTPAPDLAISAIMAVRKWTYKPYLMNGVPTDVDTTITVNFSFG